MADSATSDPGALGGPDGPSRAAGPDAELIAALDDTVARAVLGALRSSPRTADELVAVTGHDGDAVVAALRLLSEQGVLTADHPRVPGPVAYRVDGAALTGVRGLGRWFRSRSSARPERPERPRADDPRAGSPNDGDPATAHPEAASSGTVGVDGSVTELADDGRVARSAPARTRPSIAAWTNPAVAAALRRLEEQQRRSR